MSITLILVLLAAMLLMMVLERAGAPVVLKWAFFTGGPAKDDAAGLAISERMTLR